MGSRWLRRKRGRGRGRKLHPKRLPRETRSASLLHSLPLESRARSLASADRYDDLNAHIAGPFSPCISSSPRAPDQLPTSCSQHQYPPLTHATPPPAHTLTSLCPSKWQPGGSAATLGRSESTLMTLQNLVFSRQSSEGAHSLQPVKEAVSQFRGSGKEFS